MSRHSKSSKCTTKRRKDRVRTIETLERRELMAADTAAPILDSDFTEDANVASLAPADFVPNAAEKTVCLDANIWANLDSDSGELHIQGNILASTVEVVEFDGEVVVLTPSGLFEEAGRFQKSKVRSIRFDGGAGDDQFKNSTDIPAIAYGGDGNDTLVGGSADDELQGGRGDDDLSGNGGHDRLFGQDGDDDLKGGRGDDMLSGGAGDDLLEGGRGNDLLFGDGGDDDLTGGRGDDSLQGGAGDDLLKGGRGNDQDLESSANTVHQSLEGVRGNDTSIRNGSRNSKNTFAQVNEGAIDPLPENAEPAVALISGQKQSPGNQENATPGTSKFGNMTYAQLAQLTPSELSYLLNQLLPTQSVTIPDELMEGVLNDALNKNAAGRVENSSTSRIDVENFRTEITTNGIEISFNYRFQTRDWTTRPGGGRWYSPWASDSGDISARLTVGFRDGKAFVVQRNGHIDWRSNSEVTRFFKELFDQTVRDRVADAINENIQVSASQYLDRNAGGFLVEFGATHFAAKQLGISESQAETLLRRASANLNARLTPDGLTVEVIYHTWERVNSFDWSNAVATATLDGTAYVIANERLYGIRANGEAWQIGEARWLGAASMTSMGDRLYIIENSRLHEVAPDTGDYRVISEPIWKDATSIAAIGDRLYVIQADRLHEVRTDVVAEWSQYKRWGNGSWRGPTTSAEIHGTSYIIENERLHRINADGSYSKLGSARWRNDAQMTSLGDELYVVENGYLHMVDPANGKYKVISGHVWEGATSITEHQGQLAIIQNSRLHLVTVNARAETSSYRVWGNARWDGPTSMANVAGITYVIQNEHLHRVNANGGYTKLGTARWKSDARMTSMDGGLYVVENGYLHQVDPSSGRVTVVSGREWEGASSITTNRGRLVIVQAGRLHTVEVGIRKPWSAYDVIGEGLWGGHTSMATLNDRLYVIQNERLHRVTPDGRYEVIGNGRWLGNATLASAQGHLFAAENDAIWQIDPESGKHLKAADWNFDVQALITAVGGKLITVTDSLRVPGLASEEGAMHAFELPMLTGKRDILGELAKSASPNPSLVPFSAEGLTSIPDVGANTSATAINDRSQVESSAYKTSHPAEPVVFPSQAPASVEERVSPESGDRRAASVSLPKQIVLAVGSLNPKPKVQASSAPSVSSPQLRGLGRREAVDEPKEVAETHAGDQPEQHSTSQSDTSTHSPLIRPVTGNQSAETSPSVTNCRPTNAPASVTVQSCVPPYQSETGPQDEGQLNVPARHWKSLGSPLGLMNRLAAIDSAFESSFD